MGMTDGQFKAFIRFILDALDEYHDETDDEKKESKYEKIKDNLKTTLED